MELYKYYTIEEIGHLIPPESYVGIYTKELTILWNIQFRSVHINFFAGCLFVLSICVSIQVAVKLQLINPDISGEEQIARYIGVHGISGFYGTLGEFPYIQWYHTFKYLV